MANPRLFFLVCLTSITLFSFNCAAPTTNGTVSSEVNKEDSQPTSSPVITTSQVSSNGSTTTQPPQPTTTEKPKPEPTPVTTTHAPTDTPITTTKPITSTIIPSSSTNPSPDPHSSTTDSPSTTTPAVPDNKHDRAFDLPSFIGGVILALGLAAIGYVVYKFYKTRTDPNYRSL